MAVASGGEALRNTLDKFFWFRKSSSPCSTCEAALLAPLLLRLSTGTVQFVFLQIAVPERRLIPRQGAKPAHQAYSVGGSRRLLGQRSSIFLQFS
jgi:hypothetical protein